MPFYINTLIAICPDAPFAHQFSSDPQHRRFHARNVVVEIFQRGIGQQCGLRFGGRPALPEFLQQP